MYVLSMYGMCDLCMVRVMYVMFVYICMTHMLCMLSDDGVVN